MNVLSLFDGISCGQIAFNRLGITFDKLSADNGHSNAERESNHYFASEIKPIAIKCATKNYPNTIKIGDVTKIHYENGVLFTEKGKYKTNIDMIIGGSPCQSFSFAGKMVGMATKDKIEITTLEQYLELKEKGFEFEGFSYIFWEYVRLLKEIKPKYFLLENVKMAKKWEKIITNALGVEPIMIDSELVSAQARERLYWTNIPNITQPKDKNIYIDDILEKDIEHKYLPKTRLDYTNYDRTKVDKSIHKSTPTQIGNSRNFGNAVRSNGKAYTLRRINPNGIIDENYNIREFTPIEVERLQTLPDNYTLIDGIKTKERYEACGNGWTVDVISHILSNLPKEFLSNKFNN